MPRLGGAKKAFRVGRLFSIRHRSEAFFINYLDSAAAGGGHKLLGNEIFHHSRYYLAGGAHIFCDLLMGQLYGVTAAF